MQALQSSRLAALAIGTTGTVLRIDGDDDLAERLDDLGFWPGTPVTAVRRAPLGDPTVYVLRGYRLALRRIEAERILLVASDS